MRKSEPINLKCFRCQKTQFHTRMGTAEESEYMEVENGEIEPADPTIISLLQCVKCQLVSLWVMEVEFNWESGFPENAGNMPSRCIYRNIEIDAPYNFSKLSISEELAESLKIRWRDAEKCLSEGAWLGAIILIGSILEGVLLAALKNDMPSAYKSPQAPKDKSGVPRPLDEWSMNDMLEVAYGVRWINLDVRDYSKTLRDFRNFVHPHQHSSKGLIEISEGTCMISWHVMQEAIKQLGKLLRPK